MTLKEKARSNYLGANGSKRLNCAMSVSEALREPFPLEKNDIDMLKKAGGGGAPEGMCGSAFAVKIILNKYFPGRTADFVYDFAERAGSLNCDNIRKMKKLSCPGCVEFSAEFAEKLKIHSK